MIFKKYGQAPNEFTDADYKSLLEGDAFLKVSYKADRYLERYQSLMKKPGSRSETLMNFVLQTNFNQAIMELHNQLLFLRETLLQKRIITQEEINKTVHIVVAKLWPHLCQDCIHDFAVCEVEKIKFAIEIFPDLIDELADKVIECNKFERPKQEGTA